MDRAANHNDTDTKHWYELQCMAAMTQNTGYELQLLATIYTSCNPKLWWYERLGWHIALVWVAMYIDHDTQLKTTIETKLLGRAVQLQWFHHKLFLCFYVLHCILIMTCFCVFLSKPHWLNQNVGSSCKTW